MSVIGGILLYAAGIATGAGLLTMHLRQLNMAVRRAEKMKDVEITRLRAENLKLRDEADSIQRSSDCADAFRRGREKGHQLTDAEIFARRFENRTVKFVDTTRKTGT